VASPFQSFVNAEIPKRIGLAQVPEGGNLPKGMLFVSTGTGLTVEPVTPQSLGLANSGGGTYVTEENETYTASPFIETVFLAKGAVVTINAASLLAGKKFTLVSSGIDASVNFEGCQLFGLNSPSGLTNYNFNSPYETLQIVSDGLRFINTMAFFPNPTLTNANVIIGDAAALSQTAGSTRLGDMYSVTGTYEVTTLTDATNGDQTLRVYPGDTITRKSATEWHVDRGEPAVINVDKNTIMGTINNHFPHFYVESDEFAADGVTPKGGLTMIEEQLTDGMKIRIHNIGTAPIVVNDSPANMAAHKFQKADGTFTDPNSVDHVLFEGGTSLTYIYDKAAATFRISG